MFEFLESHPHPLTPLFKNWIRKFNWGWEREILTAELLKRKLGSLSLFLSLSVYLSLLISFSLFCLCSSLSLSFVFVHLFLSLLPLFLRQRMQTSWMLEVQFDSLIRWKWVVFDACFWTQNIWIIFKYTFYCSIPSLASSWMVAFIGKKVNWSWTKIIIKCGFPGPIVMGGRLTIERSWVHIPAPFYIFCNIVLFFEKKKQSTF